MNKSKVAISVIVPIFNSIEFIDECLNSVCNQAGPEIEVILVDDGSSDGSERKCDEYATRNKYVRVIHQMNKGLVCARKKGVSEARGRYVTFVDSDDWVDDAWYVKAIKVLRENAADVIAYGMQKEFLDYKEEWNNSFPSKLYTGDDLVKLKEKCLVDDKEFVLWNLLPNLCNKLILRELISKYLSNVDDKVTFGEDASCVYPCIWNAQSLLLLDDCPYHYRQRADSMSGSFYSIDISIIQSIKSTLMKSNFINSKIEEQIQLYTTYLMFLRNYSFGKSERFLFFPFEKIKQGNRIVIYGAGGLGRSIMHFFCSEKNIEIVGIIDKRGGECSTYDYEVSEPNKLNDWEYDYVIVAVLNERISEKIKNSLMSKGLDSDTILCFDRKTILNAVNELM